MDQRRRAVRRAARRRIPAGVITAVVMGVIVWPTALPRWEAILGALACGAAMVGWPWWKDHGTVAPPSVAELRAWRDGRRAAVKALRDGLSSQWWIGWDRHLPGWGRPVTFAIGPNGIWAVWGCEPGYARQEVELAATAAEALGAPPEAVWSYSGQPWGEDCGGPIVGCRAMVAEMVTNPVCLGPAEVRHWTVVVQERTMEELSAEGLA